MTRQIWIPLDSDAVGDFQRDFEIVCCLIVDDFHFVGMWKVVQGKVRTDGGEEFRVFRQSVLLERFLRRILLVVDLSSPSDVFPRRPAKVNSLARPTTNPVAVLFDVF